MARVHKESTNTELNEDPATGSSREGSKPLATGPGQAEDELVLFFAHSLDLLCVADIDGFFKRLNPTWTSCLGWTLAELQAKPFLDFIHPDDHAATLAEVAKLTEGAEVILFENRYRHRDGSFRWLRWNARPGPGNRRIYAIARDVTHQKRLERDIIEIADREQERLGRELHDGLCQTLTGIAALSKTLSRRLAASSDSAGPALSLEITQLLNEAIREAHDLARGLGPVGLMEVGLDAALGDLAFNVQHRFGVSCTFTCDRSFPRLAHEVETHLFRIAQEAVNNAATHSHGEQIDIALGAKDGQGRLSVRDDGVGVSEEALNANGIGMYTMEYRARLIGGSLEVRRRNRRGTAVTCAFPLPQTSDDTRNNSAHARNDI